MKFACIILSAAVSVLSFAAHAESFRCLGTSPQKVRFHLKIESDMSFQLGVFTPGVLSPMAHFHDGVAKFSSTPTANVYLLKIDNGRNVGSFTIRHGATSGLFGYRLVKEIIDTAYLKCQSL